MSDPYIGEIRMVGFSFAPIGWAFCDGQLMSIAQNDTLFNLIGTTYGGDGQETFALPDLRGRFPIHMGQGSGLNSYAIGEQSGTEQVTLTVQQLPAHTHIPRCDNSAAGNQVSPAGGVWSFDNSGQFGNYAATADGTQMNAAAVQNTGGNQPHDNRQPWLAINFIISLYGIFPPRN